MAHDIFISHSSKDKTVADAACACLESRGLRCWIAPRDIVAGVDWSESIIDGISGAKAMILILSSHSNVSKQVLREIERAANRGIPVLPFRVEDVQLSKSLEYFLSSAHWLDAYHGPLKHNLEKLANNAAIVIEKQDAVRPLSDAPLPTRRRRLALFAGCVGVALLGGLIAWRVVDSPPSKRTTSFGGAPETDATKMEVRPGILGEDLLPPVAKKLGAINGGVGVTRVLEQQKCGVRVGDVIVRFRDRPITNCDDILEAGWTSLSADEDYPLTVIRDGLPLHLTVRPFEMPAKQSEPNGEVRFGETRRLDPRNGMRPLSRLVTPRDVVVASDVDKKSYAWTPSAPNDSHIEVDDRTFSTAAAGSNGQIWLIDGRSGELVSWDSAAKRVIDVLEGIKDREVVDLFITHDGRTAVAIDTDGDVWTWDLPQRKVAKRFSLAERAAAHGIWWMGLHAGDFSLTANGRHLGQKTSDKFIVWDLEQGAIARLITSEKRITAGTLSPDGKLAAIASENGLIEAWSIEEEKRTATLRWHTDEVSQLLFLTPRHLVSLADLPRDGSALVWDLREQAVAWGYRDVETNGVFSFGPQLVSFNGATASLFLGIVTIREMALPGTIADELRSFAWADDTLREIAKPSQKPATDSSKTATFGDGTSHEIVDLADGSRMITERDASGNVTSMAFEPSAESCGLGVQIGIDTQGASPPAGVGKVLDGVTVEEVVVGGQAARDGVLREGDFITAVAERDGVEPTLLAGLYYAEVVRLLRGREGTSIRLTVRRHGAEESVEVVATRGRLVQAKNKAVESDFTNSVGMDFVAVPGGIGFLGIQGTSDETMASHYVRLSRGYLISAHEVTQREFAEVMATRPSAYSQAGPNANDVANAHAKGTIPSADTAHHPVESVSWDDAVDFCRRLSKKEGRVYRLPTEAEWEWACRDAGAATWKGFYPGGNRVHETAVASHLNFPQTPHPVGSRSPNDVGLYDMFGNVAEWCGDAFEDDGFSDAAFVDPKGPSSGPKRLVRGGAFKDIDSAFFKRSGLLSTEKRPYVGFRVVLEPVAGMLTDAETERCLLDTSRWQVEEVVIPNPIPAVEGALRTAEEEKKEYAELERAITEGGDLRALKDRYATTACRNQSQFDQIKQLWPRLCDRIGDRSVPSAYADYTTAKRDSRLGSISLYEQANDKDPLLGWVCNDIAWALATNPNPAHCDPAVAVARALEACQKANWQYWGFLDTLAAALAADGRYETAIRVANAAMERAPEAERPQVLYALERYKQRLAWAAKEP